MAEWIPVAVMNDKQYKDFSEAFLNGVALYIAYDIVSSVEERGGEVSLSDRDLDDLVKQFLEKELEEAFGKIVREGLGVEMIFWDLPHAKVIDTGKRAYNMMVEPEQRLKALVNRYLREAYGASGRERGLVKRSRLLNI
jgi:hypothetical protein